MADHPLEDVSTDIPYLGNEGTEVSSRARASDKRKSMNVLFMVTDLPRKELSTRPGG